jgi:hypothetical protein
VPPLSAEAWSTLIDPVADADRAPNRSLKSIEAAVQVAATRRVELLNQRLA